MRRFVALVRGWETVRLRHILLRTSYCIMLVKGILSKPTLNGKIVKVVLPAFTNGRWEVKNLVQIRPAK